MASVKQELGKAGIQVLEDTNSLTIVGGKPAGAVFGSHSDHRIAMAFSVLGTVTGDTVIEGAECVTKTYPDYWQTLKSIGGKVDINVG